ncbi:MAG TPA: GNAT family N-acetyltransferase [Candidatus Acidoferrum sp.]|nr:GNAT family N-acetyltransferase [Candidatus Acidoferrum sp.]
MIERLSSRNEAAALEFLERRPDERVVISHLVLYGSAQARSSIGVAFDDEGVRGVGYFGNEILLAGDPSTAPEFATFAKTVRRNGQRMIIGPQATVTSFWKLVATAQKPPRLVRERQFVMRVDRSMLRSSTIPVRVRLARTNEASIVAENSAQMIIGELGYDPRATRAEFISGIREMIARERWWVGESDGRICFYCNVGAWDRHTAQLQGVWSPPDARGRGLATASLAAICERLLDFSPSLSLFVNDFNEPAIALYRRVGFEYVADYKSLIF